MVFGEILFCWNEEVRLSEFKAFPIFKIEHFIFLPQKPQKNEL